MSKKKFSLEEKLTIVMRCLSGKSSCPECAKEIGTHKTVIYDWIRNYQNFGASGLTRPRKNTVYSIDVKLAAVIEVTSGKTSLRETCQKHKIRSRKQLLDWILVYNTHGNFNSVKQSGGGSYMKQGRSTTQEERIQIAKECIESDKNYGEVALKYKVSYQQARTWTLRFEELGASGLEDRRGKRKKNQDPRTELEQAQIEIERLKHQLYLAEMETNLLKKLQELERGELYLK
ncbi:MAG: transposase [Faecalibacterium sp.]